MAELQLGLASGIILFSPGVFTGNVISYSDDGFLLIEYENVNQIFDIMDIFKKFGCFSNLVINCDKADVYHINFSFNKEEKDQLLKYGFMEDKFWMKTTA